MITEAVTESLPLDVNAARSHLHWSVARSASPVYLTRARRRTNGGAEVWVDPSRVVFSNTYVALPISTYESPWMTCANDLPSKGLGVLLSKISVQV